MRVFGLLVTVADFYQGDSLVELSADEQRQFRGAYYPAFEACYLDQGQLPCICNFAPPNQDNNCALICSDPANTNMIAWRCSDYELRTGSCVDVWYPWGCEDIPNASCGVMIQGKCTNIGIVGFGFKEDMVQPGSPAACGTIWTCE